MASLSPVKRKDLISKLKKFGFTGPFSGGKHQIMVKDKLRLTLPDPHQSDIGINLLSKILQQASL